FGVIRSMTVIYAGQRRSVSLRLGRLGLADDRRHRSGQLRRLLGRRIRYLLAPGVPALAGQPLLLGGELGAVLIADEPCARAPRPVRAAFHAAAHVQRAARPQLLGWQPDDPLRRRKLGGVLPAEPAVAGPGAGLAAAGNRTEPPRPAPVGAELSSFEMNPRERGRHLLVDVGCDGRRQIAGESVDERAERSVL